MDNTKPEKSRFYHWLRQKNW